MSLIEVSFPIQDLAIAASKRICVFAAFPALNHRAALTRIELAGTGANAALEQLEVEIERVTFNNQGTGMAAITGVKTDAQAQEVVQTSAFEAYPELTPPTVGTEVRRYSLGPQGRLQVFDLLQMASGNTAASRQGYAIFVRNPTAGALTVRGFVVANE